jgi:hypothetical protein
MPALVRIAGRRTSAARHFSQDLGHGFAPDIRLDTLFSCEPWTDSALLQGASKASHHVEISRPVAEEDVVRLIHGPFSGSAPHKRRQGTAERARTPAFGGCGKHPAWRPGFVQMCRFKELRVVVAWFA